jgi:hypothetical protein
MYQAFAISLNVDTAQHRGLFTACLPFLIHCSAVPRLLLSYTRHPELLHTRKRTARNGCHRALAAG